ncbi:ribosome recycling factor [Wigglesworthia glossinidia endosymbiont of Glossina morsitans morsitans (Yale colony)]|uniref:Ribosome-recycling factor n=1 Tax=Wigglesworthia glossinidia endosymbiont of Glossina morsitans morsitans (Yale colony) TaxID=1142511 RepID=H6Q4S5_WIGGL|nr:ribosome recycling factor [Wigglesworthia glossinidia]AFA41208.1 ribosome recycling factor [Wigglesworthia glossinidia endosymbiont of Glossina morsitans morsitans (Yale colony)]
MIREIYKNANLRMKKSINFFIENISKIRTDRASPELINNIQVDYFGKKLPLNKLSRIMIENWNTLVLTIFDANNIKKIEQAILSTNLGLTPKIYHNSIRVIFPKLTEERRLKLIQLIRKESEKNIISVRNIRRNINEKIKYLTKKSIINKDEEKKFQNQIQKLTNDTIQEIKKLLLKKENDLNLKN